MTYLILQIEALRGQNITVDLVLMPSYRWKLKLRLQHCFLFHFVTHRFRFGHFPSNFVLLPSFNCPENRSGSLN